MNVPSTVSSAPPSPIQSGYHYDVVTDARLGTWTQSGRQEVVDHGIQSRDDEDVQELSTIFQELLQSCLDLRLKASQAGEVVKDIIGTRPEDVDTNARTFDPHTLFLDTISVYLDVESGNTNANLRDFMVATGVDPALMRRVLEPPILEQLGLIRDTFNRMGIRQATNILYKQANYNLLREETEGYAKLATELFTTCMSQAPSSDAIQASFERVKGLIGTFDLDVGRVLDVLLDVFASVLIKQNKFFVKFLRISSWWPSSNAKPLVFVGGLPKWALPESKHWQTSEEDEKTLSIQRLHRDAEFWTRAREVHLNAYFELGGRQLRASDLQRIQAVLDANDGSADDLSFLDPETQWIVATKTLPPQGNRVAAQLLGFKLRYYESDLLDPDEVIPANLFYMTALLIKIGFISLADLWPHLAPDDSKMQDYRAEREKILAEEERKKAGKGANALTMSVLPDDMKGEHKVMTNLEEKKTDAADKKKKNGQEVQPQKVLLLAELLTMGAIPEALYILTRYDWLPEVYPDLVKLINRLLAHSIQKVFEETMGGVRDSGAPLDIPSKRLPDMDQIGAAKGSVRLGQTQQRRPLRWPHPDGETNNMAYRYYWDEWADNTPTCQTVDDIFTLCDTLMNLSGVNIGKDPALLTKLAGIGAMSLAQDQSSQNMSRWQELLTRLLVPALSLTNANSFAVQAVWDMLKLFPVTTRYAIYSEWFLGRTSRLPSIRSAFARTKSETNSSLKRLSLTNLSAMAKKLAKTAYSSPGVVFKTAFDQIEAYPNLIQAFVECARYFTDLGYDVLTWSLMSALGGKSRSRTQEASVLLTSKWLQALSKFSGRVFKRYQNMKPAPVLQYVNSQLSRGNSTDLVILRELILSMAGVVSDLDFTDAQMRSMTGGEVLRRQTLIQLGDRRFESVSGAKRLMQSLVDTKLAGRLLINLAQYRQSALYQDDAHVKYLATIMDEIQQALAQYLDLLRSNLSPDQFDSLIPGIAELMTAYGLDVNLAFMIGRASLAHRMINPKAVVLSPAKDGRSNVQPTPELADGDGDLVMTGIAADSITNDQNLAKDENGDKMALDDKSSGENLVEASIPAAAETRKPDPIADVLQPLVDTIQDMLPSDTWQNLSPEFYVTFWSLSLGDLHVPQASYEAEHDRLYKESNDVMKDRSDMTRQGMNKKEEKKASLQALAKSIREEMSAHIERYQKTKFRLARQSKFWFTGSTAEVSAVADDLLAHCILPRLLMSTSDTEYCFRLMKFLHENQTPNFKLFALYEQFFNANRLRAIIFSATVHEADYLGRFIRCILEDLARWHADKNIYEKEAFGVKRKYLGFATAFDDEGNPTSFVEHPFFRDAHYEWHKNLNIALKACLQGTKEWMHIRNALTVLKYVSDFFPAVNFMGSQLVRVLDDIKTREAASKDASDEEEHRVDLSVAAQTIFALLKRRESKWVSVQAFRPNMVSNSDVPQQMSAATNTSKSGMPQDGVKDGEVTAPAANPALRPTAPEFKPKQAATSVTPTVPPEQPIEKKPLTQGSATTSMQPVEVEDGEVKDGKDSKSSSAPDHREQLRATPATSKPLGQDTGAAKEFANKDKPPVSSSRPATPKPNTAVPATTSSSAGRNDNSRPSGTRLPHSLPSRPDVPIPGYSRRNPTPDDRRDSPRDNREQIPPRELREPREPRDRHRDPRDVSREAREPRDHRPQDNTRGDRRDQHESGRLSERDWPSRPEPVSRRGEPSADRDARPGRDRGQAFGRDSRGPREQPVVVPQSQPAAPVPAAEEPPINPQRAALFQEDDRGEMVNPQRAALIQNAPSHSSTRSPRDSGRDRTSSRTSSPRRDDRPHPSGPSGNHGREDRHTRRNGGTAEPLPLPAREGDTPRDSDRPTSDRSRDTPHQGLPSRPQETERNRSSQQDPNYGRLNPIPSIPDTVPQGPREGPREGPRGRGARNSSRVSSTPTAPRSDGRMLPPDAPRAPSPDRQPPTGPSSSRARRGQPSQPDQAQATGGPTAHMPNTGMHPDRIRQFESGSSQVPIHPDRMNAIAPVPPPPPPSGPPPSRSRPAVPPIHTNDRAPTPTGPSGPRHGHGSLPNTPVAEQSAPYAVPTGPAGTHERQRGSVRRQLENLQNSITPNRRDSGYRGQRASVPDSDAQVLTGGSPISTPVTERPDPMRRIPMPERPQLGNDNIGLPTREPSRPGPAGDEFPSNRVEHDRNGRRDHRERPERTGRHGGRERSPRGERDARDPRSSETHERHDRRPGPPPGMDPRDPNHEPIQPRRSTRESAANSSARDSLPGGLREPSTSGRESRHHGRGDNNRGDNSRGENVRGDGGNGGRLADDWSGSGRGSLRGGPRDSASGRLGEDRRDPRGDERTSSRKRRSDVSELPPSDRDKRPRR